MKTVSVVIKTIYISDRTIKYPFTILFNVSKDHSTFSTKLYLVISTTVDIKEITAPGLPLYRSDYMCL